MAQGNGKNSILVGVDGSEAARVTALTAIRLARALGWSLHVLYVVEEVLVMNSSTDIHQELARADEPFSREQRLAWLQEQGEQALAWVVEQAAMRSVLAGAEIVFGGMPDVFLREAAAADLVALGRRGNGHTGQGEYLGHHFHAIAHHSPRPLLVGGQISGPMHRLMLAYDGEEDTEQALGWAAGWRKVLPLEVVVLVVDNDAPAGWVTDLQRHVSRSGLKTSDFVVERGDPGERIVAASVAERADALLMGSYDHNGFVEWFTGSTLDYVLRHTSIPVFISCGRPLPPPHARRRAQRGAA